MLSSILESVQIVELNIFFVQVFVWTSSSIALLNQLLSFCSWIKSHKQFTKEEAYWDSPKAKFTLRQNNDSMKCKLLMWMANASWNSMIPVQSIATIASKLFWTPYVLIITFLSCKIFLFLLTSSHAHNKFVLS